MTQKGGIEDHLNPVELGEIVDEGDSGMLSICQTIKELDELFCR